MREFCSRPGSARGIKSSPNNDVKDSAWDALRQQSGTLAEPGQPNSISLEGKKCQVQRGNAVPRAQWLHTETASIKPEASVSPSKWEDKDVYHYLDNALSS